MAINIIGAVAVVSVYWAIWYAAKEVSKKLPPVKDKGLKALWVISVGALLGSGACFIAAGLLNRPGSSDNVTITPMDAMDYGSNGGGVDQAQAIAVLIIMVVLGTMGVVGVKRTARVKAAEVAAAQIPSGYTVQTEARRQPAAYVPSFTEKIGASRADAIIEEIKAGSW